MGPSAVFQLRVIRAPVQRQASALGHRQRLTGLLAAEVLHCVLRCVALARRCKLGWGELLRAASGGANRAHGIFPGAPWRPLQARAGEEASSAPRPARRRLTE